MIKKFMIETRENREANISLVFFGGGFFGVFFF